MYVPDEKFTDFIFKNFLKNKHGGFFIEVGAYDGYEGSVCYVLEDKYGWTGINIEPNPVLFKELVEKRPNCINLRYALSSKEYITKLVYPASAPRKERAAASSIVLDNSWGPWKNKPMKEFSNIQTKLLKDLLEQYNTSCVDLLVLDIEGAEIDALEGLSGSKVLPKVIVMEDDKISKEKSSILLTSMRYKESTKRYKNNGVWVCE